MAIKLKLAKANYEERLNESEQYELLYALRYNFIMNVKLTVMNKKFICLVTTALLFATCGYSQVLRPGENAPSGTVVYSLPSTTIGLKVVADHESLVAGPYAKYAEKYLGNPARSASGEFYTINSIEMIPFVEADPNFSMAINLGNIKNGQANFLGFSSQGLIVTSDGNVGKSNSWRFPSYANSATFAEAGVSSNLTTETTTLYKTVQTAEGLENVPVQQKQIVEKSIEKKAEETAGMILKLRQKRIDIITGDTDATYSGEAMGAALNELSKLEQEYMSLFYGKSVKDQQTMLFDVVPRADMAKQMYIAFRISDTQGLLPADDMGGRPVVVELSQEAEPISPTMVEQIGQIAKNSIVYRKPVTMNAKIIDGAKVLLQTRIQVYQFGKIVSFPMTLLVK